MARWRAPSGATADDVTVSAFARRETCSRPTSSGTQRGGSPSRDDPPPYPLPDLVAEIRSPATWRLDIGAKKAAYERHGLRELWLIDTAADAVLAFRRSVPAVASFDVALELGEGEVLDSPLLPGFALALDELFAIAEAPRASPSSL